MNDFFSMEEPLYQLPDDAEKDTLYTIDDDLEDMEEFDEEDESDAGESVAAKSAPSPPGILIKTMLTPVEGWKSLRRARFTKDEVARKCFYPIVGFAAFSEGASIFYEANYSISDWAIEGLCTFITFFFGYFVARLLGMHILPADSRAFLKKDIGGQFIMIAMSSLALFWSAIQIVPMFDPVLVFLPIWTIYMIYKGAKVMRIPAENRTKSIGLLCLLVIGVPILCSYLLTEFLISNPQI
ncbi:MAG: hypothetical protein K2M87_02935 [Muribaculaceae bacterium]|nr:hypothetical protein [Muribaculaceae bacterium]